MFVTVGKSVSRWRVRKERRVGLALMDISRLKLKRVGDWEEWGLNYRSLARALPAASPNPPPADGF